MTNQHDAVIETLVSSIPHLVEASCAQIFRQQSSYANVHPDSLEASIKRNVNIAIQTLARQRVPEAASLESAEVSATERFHANVPVEEVIVAFRTSISHIHDLFISAALTHRSPAEVLEGSRLLWQVSDAFVNRVVSVYHRLELERDTNSNALRTAALKDLLNNGAQDDSFTDTLGLVASEKYAAIITSEIPPEQLENVRSALSQSGSTAGLPAVVVTEHNRCIGVVSEIPTPLADVVIGIGDFQPPTSLQESWRLAQKVLLFAHDVPHDGVVTVHDVGWLLAVIEVPWLSNMYLDLYIRPLYDAASEHNADMLLGTVEEWLKQSRRIPQTATALRVHVNTVRYRLERFAEITGCNLESFEDGIGVLWAIRAHRLGIS